MAGQSVKWIGRVPQDLASGRVVAPGEVFDRSALLLDDDENQHDPRLMASGFIIDAHVGPAPLEGDELQDRAKALGIPRRSTMSADELRQAVAEAEARDATDDLTGGNE